MNAQDRPAGVLEESLLVYAKEVRSLARDRHTVIYSVLLPLFLYPGLVWGLIQAAAYVRATEEREDSNVLVVDGSEEKELERFLAATPKVKVVRAGPEAEARAREVLVSGAAHALVVNRPERPGAPAASVPAALVRLLYSASSPASAKARERIEAALRELRLARLRAAAAAVGGGGDFLDVLRVEEKDLSTPEELANYLASLILPLLMTVMMALGALYPALDSTVGEKERGTLETTLVSPARRISTVAGKYLAVATFALLAFLLNFASMGFTLAHLGSQLKLEKLTLGAAAVLVILGAATLLALFLSAVMMLIGFVARSFREGQAYVTPVYLLAVLPALLTSSPDVLLTPALACVPVVNASLLFREALRGSFPAMGIALTLSTSAGYAAVALLGAARLLRREPFATGKGLPLREALAGLLARR